MVETLAPVGIHHSPSSRRTNRSRLTPPVGIVDEEKGWWEGEDSPEAEPSMTVVWLLVGLLFILTWAGLLPLFMS